MNTRRQPAHRLPDLRAPRLTIFFMTKRRKREKEKKKRKKEERKGKKGLCKSCVSLKRCYGNVFSSLCWNKNTFGKRIKSKSRMRDRCLHGDFKHVSWRISMWTATYVLQHSVYDSPISYNNASNYVIPRTTENYNPQMDDNNAQI